MNEYQRIVNYINTWEDIPSEAHFERHGAEETPDLLVRAEKGGTAADGGRNFSLTYRIYPDAEGEYLYAADFFDEIEAFFAANAFPLTAAESSAGKNGRIETRSGVVCAGQNRDGSRSYTAQYALHIELPGTGGSGGGSSTGGSADPVTPLTVTLTDADQPSNTITPVCTAVSGFESPAYLTESASDSFGEGAFYSEVRPAGRVFKLTIPVSGDAMLESLIAIQGWGEVLVSAKRGASGPRSSLCRLSDLSYSPGKPCVLTFVSEFSYLRGTEHTGTFMTDMSSGAMSCTVSVPGPLPKEYSFSAVMTADTSALTLSVGGRDIAVTAAMKKDDVLSISRKWGRVRVTLNGERCFGFPESTEFPPLGAPSCEIGLTVTGSLPPLTTLKVCPLYYGI